MKYLYVIFAIFILTVSVIPCVDAHTENNAELEFSQEHNSNNENHNEDCSPFCTCDCCSISVINSSVRIFDKEQKSENSIVFFHYSFDYSFEYYFSVWNPPKV